MTSLENQSRVLYYNMLMKADNERFSVLIVSIKPVYNPSMVGCIDQVKKTLPETIEQRILVNIENKKNSGAILCESCKKVWDKHKVCRLCQLTS